MLLLMSLSRYIILYWGDTRKWTFISTNANYWRIVSWADCQRVKHLAMGLLPDTLNCGFAHAPGMSGTFSPPPISKEAASYRSRHASRHVHHGTCVTHVRWCMSGSLTRSGMRNPQFYVSGKRPTTNVLKRIGTCCIIHRPHELVNSRQQRFPTVLLIT